MLGTDNQQNAVIGRFGDARQVHKNRETQHSMTQSFCLGEHSFRLRACLIRSLL